VLYPEPHSPKLADGVPVERDVELAVPRPEPAHPAAAPDVAVPRAAMSELQERQAEPFSSPDSWGV
jgi:hypothetical protein